MVCDGADAAKYGRKLAVAVFVDTKYTMEKLLVDGKMKLSIGKKVHWVVLRLTDPSPGCARVPRAMTLTKNKPTLPNVIYPPVVLLEKLSPLSTPKSTLALGLAKYNGVDDAPTINRNFQNITSVGSAGLIAGLRSAPHKTESLTENAILLITKSTVSAPAPPRTVVLKFKAASNAMIRT